MLNIYFSLNLPKWCWFVGVLCKWLLSTLLDKLQCYRNRGRVLFLPCRMKALLMSSSVWQNQNLSMVNRLLALWIKHLHSRFHIRMKAERKTSLSGILNGLDINRHIGFPSLGATGRKSPHHHCSEITSMAASLQHNILLNTPPTDTSCR